MQLKKLRPPVNAWGSRESLGGGDLKWQSLPCCEAEGTLDAHEASRLYLRLETSNMSGSGQAQVSERRGWGGWILNHFPPGQFGRYLMVGVVNTAFGYGTYAGLTALFTPHIPYPYMLASVISSSLNITFSFLTYKRFIFKTKGNHLREWSRCVVVYGGTYALAVSLLPVSVYLVRHLTAADKSAPYVAGALQMAVLAMLGFLGHKTFSFAPKRNSQLTQPE